MPFEQFESGKRTEQIIAEVIEDLDRGLEDPSDHHEALAKLITARTATMPNSNDRKKIDELLNDIEVRYGKV